jgi:histidinol phosphatase-like enzyme
MIISPIPFVTLNVASINTRSITNFCEHMDRTHKMDATIIQKGKRKSPFCMPGCTCNRDRKKVLLVRKKTGGLRESMLQMYECDVRRFVIVGRFNERGQVQKDESLDIHP